VGTKHQGTAREVRALDAYIKLMRAADAVTDRVHRHLEATGLTVSQFGVLEALHHLGPLTQGVLASKLLKSGANMTTVVGNLERRGLVTRRRGGASRRYVTVTLTAEGRRRIASVFPRHVAEVVRAFEPLSARDQELLSILCKRVGLQAARAAPRRPPGAPLRPR
jgi:MarR family 2-MHQ and catechol resistance regulon transcriptional repressor